MKSIRDSLALLLVTGLAAAPAQAHVDETAHIHDWIVASGWSGAGVVAGVAVVVAMGVRAIRIARRR